MNGPFILSAEMVRPDSQVGRKPYEVGGPLEPTDPAHREDNSRVGFEHLLCVSKRSIRELCAA